jgi:hypothetical protein
MPQNAAIKAVWEFVRQLRLKQSLRSMEIQRARQNKLFICSKRCCLAYSMIFISEATPTTESSLAAFRWN